MTYKTKGTCSQMIEFEITDGKVHNVKFTGGCNGNLKGIGQLVEGMDAEEVIKRLEGTTCGFKSTSCPDQLATALEEYKANHAACAARRFRPPYRKTDCSMQPVFSFSPWRTRRARP